MAYRPIPRYLATLLLAGTLAQIPYAIAQSTTVTLDGRSAVVYLPTRLPPVGSRALVVVLHGGLGNAQRIAQAESEAAINLDTMADTHGFVVAYLNGTPVARLLSAERRGWNAGNCCGLPAEKNVDDVAYLQSAVHTLISTYGIDRQRIFGVGHSNGAMMIQRVVCETGLFAAAVSLAGSLENNAKICPAAKGKRILALHGEHDQNVPIVGGRGPKGIARVAFTSQAATTKVWQDSGVTYDFQVVPGADHFLGTINTQLQLREGQSLGQKIVQFFGVNAK